MALGLPEKLTTLVARRFTEARDGGHLVFSPTQLTVIKAAGLPWQLRYCPALAKKPTNPASDSEDGTRPPKPDPFQNPSPDLLIAHFPPENPKYSLVLNKFPVIPNHFILATKDWKPQTDLLESEDLAVALECLQAWGDEERAQGRSDEEGSSLFAFFNSGEHSGASQPHRHIQFLPVDAMRQPGSEGWDPLIDIIRLAAREKPDPGEIFPLALNPLPHLPFYHLALPLPRDTPVEMLHRIYLALYRFAVIAHLPDNALGKKEPLPCLGPSLINYNLAMTESTMVLCPRIRESAVVPIESPPTEDINEPGVISLNGTILAGTLMVKAEAEWDALRRDPEHLTRGLATIGLKNPDYDSSS